MPINEVATMLVNRRGMSMVRYWDTLSKLCADGEFGQKAQTHSVMLPPTCGTLSEEDDN